MPRMLSKLVVVVAVGLYLVVTSCAVLGKADGKAAGPGAAVADPAKTNSSAGRPARSAGLPFVAVGMQIQRTDWIDKYEQSIDEIAALGADAVKIVVDARQEHGRSSQIYLDLRMTPSVEALQRLIKHAKTRGLKVILMPIVLLDRPTATEWRGTLAPENWGEWFKSYRSMMGHFAWIAESGGVDMLVVGSELVSSETKVDEWRKTIAHVRKIYKGKLTYSSNWDKYETVAFWDDLDVIGMNSYWKLDGGKKSKAQVDDIVAAWGPILRDVTEFASEQGKPVFFLEVGWCSIANAAHEPWDYTADREPIDNDLQKRLYEGFFQTWWGNEHLAGFSVWEWTPGDGGKDEQTVNRRGYTPENKPAEAVLRQWLAKDRWAVR